MDAVKAKGFDFLVFLFTFCVVLMSYSLTIDILQGAQDNKGVHIDFLRGSFVFLAPCALEGLTLIVSKVEKKVLVDRAELVIGILSIALTGYLWYAIANDVKLLSSGWIQFLMLMYPIKVGVNLVDSVIDLIKARGNKE